MLPHKLKSFNLFLNGISHKGLCSEVTLPKLARKMESYRGAGMDGEIQIDMGQEPIEFEWKLGGLEPDILLRFGAVKHSAEQVRFVGAYQSDSSSKPVAVEIIARGRHQEIDSGSAKGGGDTEMTIKTVCAYYKLLMGGITLIEIDIENMKFIVGGNDILKDQRAIIG